MRTIVAGSRYIEDRKLLDEVMDKAARVNGIVPSVVLSGGATGVDSMAVDWARDNGIPWRVFPAGWEAYGQAAGPERNRRMLEVGRAEALVALWDGRSPGTRNMIRQAASRVLPHMIHVPRRFR